MMDERSDNGKDISEEEASRVSRSKNSLSYRPFLLALLFFSLYLAYLVVQPFLHTIIFAVILASLFHPIHLVFVRYLKGRKSLAALIMVVLITFLIVLPTIFFVAQLISQGVDSITQVNTWIRSGQFNQLLSLPKIVGALDWAKKELSFIHWQTIDIRGPLLGASKNFAQFLINHGAALVGNMADVVVRFFIMMFIVFYLLRDGQEMVAAVKYLSPLREDQEDRILEKIRAVARSSLLGTFLTALCQGIVGGIGLMMVGIPAFFWGSLMGFASLIPVVGTALIWIPASVYLVLVGSWKSGVFLALWCILLVGSIDNFLRPFFMRGQAEMSPFYIFLAIIGGIQCFGLPGIVYGPLTLAFAKVMLYIYEVEYKDLLDEGPVHGEEPGQSRVAP